MVRVVEWRSLGLDSRSYLNHEDEPDGIVRESSVNPGCDARGRRRIQEIESPPPPTPIVLDQLGNEIEEADFD